MNRIRLALRALSGNLAHDMERLGIVRADQVQVGWVIRTPGQGRGKRWWVRACTGPTGPHGLIRLTVRLVEVHGVRARADIRALGQDPDHDDSLYIEHTSIVVIEYLDWSEDEGGQLSQRQ